MSAQKDVMGHNLCPYVSIQGECGSRYCLRAGTMVSKNLSAARLCNNSENSVPVKLVRLALECGFLKCVQSFWIRGKI